MIKNKRGFVIGNAILSVITIIVIVFIMGTFIIVASYIAVLKKPAVTETTQQITADIFFSHKLTITDVDGTNKEISLLEAISLSMIYLKKLEEIRSKITDNGYMGSLAPEQKKSLYEEQRKYHTFLSNYKKQLLPFFENLNKKSPSEVCFILIKKPLDIENNKLSIVVNNFDFSSTGKDIFISIKDGKAKPETDSYGVERNYAKTERLASMPPMTINLGNGKTEPAYLAYYYGVCYNDK